MQASEMFEGHSPSIRTVQARVQAIGWSDAPVLIQGETGTGKEIIARELHARSRRSDKSFVKVNCAALPAELIESELFGYERGAFTGALRKKSGLFEEAHGGTLLLDEIGDMDSRLQSKLLHVLQDNSFLRIGGRTQICVDVRVMAATHCDLEEEMEKRRFRQDLFYRLNVINIHLPPLRERTEDIPALADFMIRKHAMADMPTPAITAELSDALIAYRWPGNIRELENCIRKLLILGDAATIARELRRKSALSAGWTVSTAPPATPAVGDRNRDEAEAILSALTSTCWNRRRAATLLQMDYRALRVKMKKFGIGPSRSNASGAGGNGC